jgi:hypothetical protein
MLHSSLQSFTRNDVVCMLFLDGFVAVTPWPLVPLWVAWLRRANDCNCNCNYSVGMLMVCRTFPPVLAATAAAPPSARASERTGCHPPTSSCPSLCTRETRTSPSLQCLASTGEHGIAQQNFRAASTGERSIAWHSRTSVQHQQVSTAWHSAT